MTIWEFSDNSFAGDTFGFVKLVNKPNGMTPNEPEWKQSAQGPPSLHFEDAVGVDELDFHGSTGLNPKS